MCDPFDLFICPFPLSPVHKQLLEKLEIYVNNVSKETQNNLNSLKVCFHFCKDMLVLVQLYHHLDCYSVPAVVFKFTVSAAAP